MEWIGIELDGNNERMAANGGLMTENDDGQMVANGSEWWARD